MNFFVTYNATHFSYNACSKIVLYLSGISKVQSFAASSVKKHSNLDLPKAHKKSGNEY